MPIKKSELYSSLWKSCDELRGGMDASQYKDYVLVLLFVKYVSDKYAGDPNALIDVPDGGSFKDMVALKGDKEIGDKINKIIGKLAEANELKGVIDVADFNDADKLGKGKDMVDTLSKLVAIFENPGLDFSRNRAEGDDILGDAYEYLMRHFATESGKSKGQFYTPAEVSRIMAKVIGIGSATSSTQTVYDPTCGSGSLLLKAHDEALVDISIYGQEKDVATTALAKMNMILHNCPTAEIALGGSSTLSSPHFKEKEGGLKRHDYVVANPPFSTKAWSNGFDPANDLYNRFADGIPPAKNGDYAFLLHILTSLKSSGKGAVILPHGVLFRGGAEGTIRTNIIRKGYIKGIIGLPANLFYGTGIPACIIVLDKEHAASRSGIFMIDASKGFVKDGNKNRLRHQDIHKIVDVFTKQTELAKYSRMVSRAEIEANDFNLNIPRYIDATEPEDLQDIEAHLKGGIPNRDIDDLSRYWQVFPSLRQTLFAPLQRSGYSNLTIAAAEVKAAIFSHPEFSAFNSKVTALFELWKNANHQELTSISIGGHPKQLIDTISESLLDSFRAAPLLDPYDVYQHLMTYWSETMQDDVYLLVQEGWQAIIEGKPNTDLIPPSLMVSRYFKAEQQQIEQLEAARDAISRQMEELEEENSGEDGLLEEARTDKGKLTSKSIKDRLKAIKSDKDAADERKLLEQYLELLEQEAAANKKVKDSQKALDTTVKAKYATLSEAEVKTLVVDDKWLATLAADVQTELDRVSQALTSRIRQLAERYAMPLPQLTSEVEALSATVDAHLQRMGFVWN
ncbi:type I restriction-modification system subunit M [Trichlorobacter lovleyi]|uniref:type I restriction-modification system subunit M n=1 Tax=Trichlorobacter lovleyi TaxID=313985 RepID=UPI00223F2AD2|nr:type I restriction-modification system subunit M [Trichlorobacter lovleyi]QOX79844.1 type I restriction-modification system subunit M [Trichlorobacter lovleyi]